VGRPDFPRSTGTSRYCPYCAAERHERQQAEEERDRDRRRLRAALARKDEELRKQSEAIDAQSAEIERLGGPHGGADRLPEPAPVRERRMTRLRAVTVKLSDDEYAVLEERCPVGVSKAEYMRSLLREAPAGASDPPTRERVLETLWEMARAGKAAAAVALERALRDDRQPQTDDGWLERAR
jgi:hypothetical protein